MNYTEPKVIYTCFPGGKHKVLTMSYDDGRLEDRRLVELFNRYGIRGTFNLNGGLPRPERIPQYLNRFGISIRRFEAATQCSSRIDLSRGHIDGCLQPRQPLAMPQ